MRLYLPLFFLTTAFSALLPKDILMDNFPLQILLNLSFVNRSFYENIHGHFSHSHLNLTYKLAHDYQLMEFLEEFKGGLNEGMFYDIRENNIALRCIEILGSLWKLILPRIQSIEFIDEFRPRIEAAVINLTQLVPLSAVSKSGHLLAVSTGIVLARNGFAPILTQYLPTFIHSEKFLGKIDYSLFACQLAREIHITQLEASRNAFDLLENLTDGEFIYILLERGAGYKQDFDKLLESKLASEQSVNPERLLSICLDNYSRLRPNLSHSLKLREIMRNNDYAIIRQKLKVDRIGHYPINQVNDAFAFDLILVSATRKDIPNGFFGLVNFQLIENDFEIAKYIVEVGSVFAAIQLYYRVPAEEFLNLMIRLAFLLFERIPQNCDNSDLVERQIHLLTQAICLLPQPDLETCGISREHIEQVRVIIGTRFGLEINLDRISWETLKNFINGTPIVVENDKVLQLTENGTLVGYFCLRAIQDFAGYHPLISSCLVFHSEPALHVEGMGCMNVVRKIFGIYDYGLCGTNSIYFGLEFDQYSELLKLITRSDL